MMTNDLRQSQNHRRDIMKVLLGITITAACIYGFINFTRGVWVLGGLELGYAGLSFGIYRIIDTTPKVRRWILVYLIPLLGLITYALYLPTTSHTMFAWILITPIVLYLLLGSKLGMWFSIAFVTVNIVGYQLRFFTGDLASLHNAGIYNILISSFAITIFSHIYERNRENTELRLIELAGTDQLTGLPNRMKLAEDFHHVRATADRLQWPVAVAMIDLDHFKSVNDEYGHGIGDRALCHLADIIRKSTREVDLPARLGGEEFTLVMPNTSSETGKKIVDRLRQAFSRTPIQLDGQSLFITFSAGISQYDADGEDLETLIASADRRLYVAKANGRNQVVVDD
jgi:diguanylate cyclase (GGDEF)-like protein